MATNNSVNLKNAGIVSYDGAGTFSALANPLTVANGGAGSGTHTAYAVLCGGTSSTNPIQSIASVGSTGQVLTSNGAGALPTFQAAPGQGIIGQFVIATGSPLDATTYFLLFGRPITQATASGNMNSRIYAPTTCTLTSCYGTFGVAGTLGTTEQSSLYLRHNNTTDHLVTSTLQLDQTFNSVSNNSLNISMSAGDYVEFKFIGATWSTNPTSVECSLTVYFG